MVAFAAACAGLAGSCVQRRIVVDSVPRGALVTLDGNPIGRTPVNKPFAQYGTRALTIRKRGYTTQTHVIDVRPPLYERFPIDLFFEAFWPTTLYDLHCFMYNLSEAMPTDREKLLKRATKLRDRALKPMME